MLGTSLSPRHLAHLAVVLCLLSPRPTHAASLTLASNASWNAFSMNPDGSVGTALGSAECYSLPVAFDVATIPGACCIWLPGMTPSSSSNLQGVFFRKTISIAGTPTSATIVLAVDDWAEISINGAIVATRGSITNVTEAAAAQYPLASYDITRFLRHGNNDLQVWARNGPGSFAGGCEPCPLSANGAWVYFGGSITYDNPVPTMRSTWAHAKQIYR